MNVKSQDRSTLQLSHVRLPIPAIRSFALSSLWNSSSRSARARRISESGESPLVIFTEASLLRQIAEHLCRARRPIVRSPRIAARQRPANFTTCPEVVMSLLFIAEQGIPTRLFVPRYSGGAGSAGSKAIRSVRSFSSSARLFPMYTSRKIPFL